MSDTLEELIHKARTRAMDPQEREAQRVSFAFGNAPEGDQHTKETVKAALENSPSEAKS